MGYINMNDIRIFPTSERTATQKSGTNWLTEYNISNIVNQLTGSKGFVTHPRYGEKINSVSSGSTEEIKFNIGGYYFETTVGAVEKAANSTSTSAGEGETSYITFTIEKKEEEGPQNRIASIKLSKISDTADVSYKYLVGKDGGNDDTEGDEPLELILYDKEGNIPQSSRLTFPGLFIKVDDGVLS